MLSNSLDNVQECLQLEGWDISGAAQVNLRRRIAAVAHIRSEGCHGRQTELKRREGTNLKRISKDESVITFERCQFLNVLWKDSLWQVGGGYEPSLLSPKKAAPPN